MAFIDPDDYWAHTQSCAACGMTYSLTKQGVDDHATRHMAEYRRFFEWDDEIIEDVLDAEYLTEQPT